VLAAVLCILVFFVIFLVISQRRKPEEAARQVADAATIKKWSDNAIRRGEEWGKQSQPTVPPLALPSPQASTPLNKIPDGSTFGITEVSQTEKPDPKAEMNLTLRIALKKRPNATIDHTKVMIQAFFYDRVDDKDIKLTDADVNYEWLTPKHDWMETNPEILSINYLRPKGIVTSAGRRNGPFDLHPGPKSKVTSAGPFGLGPEPRKYLGYRVLVYYDNKLQAVRAEPARLLNLFPPSPTVVSSFSQDGLKALTRGDYISAGKLFQEAADQGDTTAQSNLASLYVQGKGVPQDYRKAVELYQKAADQGDTTAQNDLASLYEQGKGVPQDYRKAVELYQKAADQGYVLGEVNLGSLHYRGKGVPQDYRKAAELFEKAVSQGDAVGQAYLASQYAEGKGVPQDYRKAAELYHTAVAQGRSPNAFNEFAWFLATCPDDSQRSGKEAVSYANKACQLSGWKEANFIGTLAAAYAEVGDFNAAVYYQKRAMDMGSDYPDKQVMEKALKLYQERKPYRE
jgi:TPR repeat protein